MKVEWKSPIKCAKELRVEEVVVVVVEIDSLSLLGKMFSKFDRFVTSYNYTTECCVESKSTNSFSFYPNPCQGYIV